MKKPTRKSDVTPRPRAKAAQGTGYGTNPRKRTRTDDDEAPRARRAAPAGTGSPRRSRTEDDAAPRAKRPYTAGTGNPRRSRNTEEGAAPRAKRPTASGYGATPKRRTRPDEDTPTFRKPKAVTDGGERPATRRRTTAAGSDEPRPRRKSTAEGAAPRRGFTSRFGNDEPKPYARPRRNADSDREERPAPRSRFGDKEERPAPRSRFGDKEKPRFEKPGAAGPARRFESKFKKRDEDTGTSRPARRTTERFGNSDEKRPRRPTGFGGESTGRFAPKGKDDVKKNFRSKPVRTPDYDFSEVEAKGKGKRTRAEKVEKDDSVRLNRYIANAGVCSRRDADVLIQSGEIKVNGNPVTEMGYQVKPGDIVKYGNRVLNREKMVYVLLNKPKDFITTTEDPEERRTVMDLVKEAADTRLFPVGRLDRNTTGLLLLTNDGELAEKLTHPSYNIKKIYEVQLDKPISEEDFNRALEGVELEDGKAEVDELATVSPDRTVLGIELHLGRNRIVRRIFEHLGYDVIKLDRVMYAGLDKKDLPRGKWRYLSEKEVIRLKYFL
ncbi:MAG: Ribosomal large subunit pseudouridine synthase B [uncultured Cytophagales bacterium]|uniref:Pseudouridine synthase n=1 Tax=uncultured Cytophagales bacterium TaxID=158755 RepID=A0A6J4KVM8_9SPHI|nr:MAG: Ribosomal large subunit pseudouridine synthase B [uncultured Cytophagales bacterium]